MRIVVVGAGSIGAHVAYRLALRGADVTVIDARTPASGTTAASFAWLSSFPQVSWQEEPGRAALRRGVHDRFRALHDELGGDWLHWTGTLTWSAPAERAALVAAYESCRAAGLAVELLDAPTARSEAPLLTIDDDEVVVWETDSGWVDAPVLVGVLLDRVVRAGGTVLTGRPVTGMDIRGDRVRAVRLADGRSVDADVIVNAAGSWAAHVAALAGCAVPIDLVPGLMVYLAAPPEHCPDRIVNAPTWLARPAPDGGLAVHWRGEPMSSVHGGNASSTDAIVADIARTVPSLSGAAVSDVRVGIRAVPHGGPIIGALPWQPELYFAVSHGGIGWGPVWADIAAREILDGERVSEATAMRPERFYLGPRASAGRFADDFEQAAADG